MLTPEVANTELTTSMPDELSMDFTTPDESMIPALTEVQNDRRYRQAETYYQEQAPPTPQRVSTKVTAATPEAAAIMSKPGDVAMGPKPVAPPAPKEKGIVEAGLHGMVEGVSKFLDPAFKKFGEVAGDALYDAEDYPSSFADATGAKKENAKATEEALRFGMGIFGPFIPEPGTSEGPLMTGLGALGMLPLVGGVARGARGLAKVGGELVAKYGPKAEEVVAQAGAKVKASLESLSDEERFVAMGVFEKGKPGLSVEHPPLPKIAADFSPEEMAMRQPLTAIVARDANGNPIGTLMFNPDKSMVQLVTVPNTDVTVLRSLWAEGQKQGLTIADITKQTFTAEGARLTDVLISRYQRAGLGDDTVGRGVVDKFRNFRETGVAPTFLPEELARLEARHPGVTRIGEILNETGAFSPGDILKGVEAIYGDARLRTAIGAVGGAANEILQTGGDTNPHDLLIATLEGAGLGLAARALLNSATAIPQIFSTLKKANIRGAITLDPQMTVKAGNSTVKINTQAFANPETVNVTLDTIKDGLYASGLARNAAPSPQHGPAFLNLAEKLGLSSDEVATVILRAEDPAATMMAWDSLVSAHWNDYIVPLTKQAVGGSAVAQHEFLAAWRDHVNLLRQFVNKPHLTLDDFVAAYRSQVIERPMEKLGRGSQLKDISLLATHESTAVAIWAAQLDEAKRLPQAIAKMNKLNEAPIGDAFNSYLYFSLLSSPTTHFANISGSALITPLIEVMERNTAQFLPAFLAASGKNKADVLNNLGVQMGEANAMASAWAETIWSAMKVIDGAGPGGSALGKLMYGMGQAKAKVGVTHTANPDQGPMSAIVDHVSSFFDIPTHALAYEDALLGALNYNMAVKGFAARTGVSQGLKGPELSAHIAGIVADPPAYIIAAAKQEASKRMFTNTVPGWVEDIKRASNVIFPLKLIVPFITTPFNIASYGFQRTPILQAFSPTLYRELAAGGASAQLAQAKLVNGMAYAYVGYNLAMEGRITGNGPKNPELRAVWLQTHQPNSIRIGDDWYSFAPLDPIAAFLGGLADTVFSITHLDDEEIQNQAIYDVALTYGMAAAANMESKNWTRSIGETFALARSLGQQTPETMMQKLGKYGSARLQMLFPALLRKADTAVFENTQAEVNTFTDKWNQLTPWNNDKRSPKLTYFGDVVVLDTFGPKMLSPIAKMGVVDDPVVNEIVATSANMPEIPRVVGGVRLTGEQRHDYIKEFSNTTDGHEGPTLYEALTAAINSEYYKTLKNDTQRGIYIHEAAIGFQITAMARMLDPKYTAKWGGENPFTNAIEIENRKLKRQAGEVVSQVETPAKTTQAMLDRNTPKRSTMSGMNLQQGAMPHILG